MSNIQVKSLRYSNFEKIENYIRNLDFFKRRKLNKEGIFKAFNLAHFNSAGVMFINIFAQYSKSLEILFTSSSELIAE